MSDAAVANLITGLVTITTVVVGFLTIWVKLKYGVQKAEEAATKAKVVEEKIDNNTAVAAFTATVAKVAADNLSEQINGLLDNRITVIVERHFGPLREELKAHSAQDEKNMNEIRDVLNRLVSK